MMRNPRSWFDVTEEACRFLIEQMPRHVLVRQNHVPNAQRPDLCVVVRRVGTLGSGEWIDHAVLDIEVWGGPPGAGPEQANEIANSVREHLLTMPEESNPVRKMRVGGPTWQPDLVSGAPRVIMRADVWCQPTEKGTP